MRRVMKYLATGSVVLTACVTVIVILVSTIVYRIAVYTAYVTRNPEEQDQASLIASGTAAVINLAVIILLSFVRRSRALPSSAAVVLVHAIFALSPCVPPCAV